LIRTLRAFKANVMWRVRDPAIGAAAAMLAIAASQAYAQSAPAPAAAPATAAGAAETASAGAAPADLPRRPPAPPIVEEGRFAIILESVPVSELSRIRAIPARLQGYNIFGSQVTEGGVAQYELVLGYFESEADAQKVLAAVLGDFPRARIFDARSQQAAPMAASTPATPDEEPASDAELIVVSHHRTYAEQFGAALGNIEPELQLSPADVRSYGVSTVSELIQELAPEARSERGRGGEEPVMLLNGWRISSLNEVLTLPTEAILRVDILPEEVALKYGFSANQRVINIVLRRKFHGVAAQLAGGGPTEGGEVNGKAEADLLHIQSDNRLNLDLNYRGSSGLTEASRGVVQLDPARSGEDRSLIPALHALSANAVLSRPLGDGLNATGNATLTADTSDSLRGRPGASVPGLSGDVLHHYVNDWAAHLGSALNKEKDEWRLSITGTYDHINSQTDSDRVDATGSPFIYQNHTRSITDAANVQVIANGPVLSVPAGPLFASITAGDAPSRLSANSRRITGTTSDAVDRNEANGRIDVDLPLASRHKSVLPLLGELSLNANGAINQVTDFGSLTTYGYGLNWTPIPGYVLGASHTRDQAAPTIQQIGAPAVSIPGVRLFDYIAGQTVDVAQVTGGSPDLSADARNILKIGLTMKPIEGDDLTFIANYVKVRSEHPILALAAATPAVQAAFPQRFTRDSTGRVIKYDLRPINIAGADRSDLRWGINYSQRIGQNPVQAVQEPATAALQNLTDKRASGGEEAGARAASAAGGPESTKAVNAPSGPGHRRHLRSRANEGRFQFTLYHTLYLTDRQQLTPGGPIQDLLNGAAATGIGGQYRNEVEAKLGISLKGFGARLSADWRQGTSVQGGATSPAGDLHFSDITTLNLRLFANLGQQKDLVSSNPWLRGVRVGLYVNNLLDERVQVRDANGATPLAYQPGYIDPSGRTVLLSVRKLFF
jgi:iron complex outermembrane recepter protein